MHGPASDQWQVIWRRRESEYVEEISIIELYGATQKKLLESLLHHPDGMSVEELVNDLEISTNAVRQHLAALERDNMIERAGQRPTGRRPEMCYALTAHGQEAFPRRYRQLAEHLIEEICETIGPDALAATMQKMGTKAGKQVGNGLAKTDSVAALLREAGYDAQQTPDQPDEVVAHNCVFHRLAERYPAVCQYDLAFMAAATGAEIEHKECIIRQDSVCRFKFVRHS
ncbi:helix-turn-helix transcriptional regulator [Ampullimonas aquatilis]|uniref:helix-turn-helix transcriptional regulator n=1 Tax=Ampullimonas aquatilis TaxID=1341549 RepID=UPI003C7348EC